MITAVNFKDVLITLGFHEDGFSIMSKSVNQANINGALLKQYCIPVPILEEQNRLVQEIQFHEQKIENAQKIINIAPREETGYIE